MSKPKSEIRVDCPNTAEHPNGAYAIRDLDDGNVQFRDETVDNFEAEKDVPVMDQLNDVLTNVALGQVSMYTTHKVKTRPDRWAGQKGKTVKNSKPYINYQNIRWSDYHKTNPSKGSTGYIGPNKFARVQRVGRAAYQGSTATHNGKGD